MACEHASSAPTAGILRSMSAVSTAPTPLMGAAGDATSWYMDMMFTDSSMHNGRMVSFSGMHVNTSLAPAHPLGPLTTMYASFATPHGQQVPTIFSPSLLIVTPAAEQAAFLSAPAAPASVAPLQPPPPIQAPREGDRAISVVGFAAAMPGLGDYLLPSPTCFTMRHAAGSTTILAPAFAPPKRTMVQMCTILPGLSSELEGLDEATLEAHPSIQVDDASPVNGTTTGGGAADTLSPGLTHAFSRLRSGVAEAPATFPLGVAALPRVAGASRGRGGRPVPFRAASVQEDASSAATATTSGRASKRGRSARNQARLDLHSEVMEGEMHEGAGIKRARLSPVAQAAVARDAAATRLQRKRTGAAIVLTGGVWSARVDNTGLDRASNCDVEGLSVAGALSQRTSVSSGGLAEEAADGFSTQRSSFGRGRARGQCTLSPAEAQVMLTDILSRPVDHAARIENMNPGVKHLQHVIDADADVPVPEGYLALDEWMDSRGMRLEFSSVHILKTWFAAPENWRNPYPTDPEKEELSTLTGLSIVQVANWLRNERKRVWLPLKRDAVKRSNRVIGGGPSGGSSDGMSKDTEIVSVSARSSGTVRAPGRAVPFAANASAFTSLVDDAATTCDTFSALIAEMDKFGASHAQAVEASTDAGTLMSVEDVPHASAAPPPPRVQRYKRSATFV